MLWILSIASSRIYHRLLFNLYNYYVTSFWRSETVTSVTVVSIIANNNIISDTNISTTTIKVLLTYKFIINISFVRLLGFINCTHQTHSQVLSVQIRSNTIRLQSVHKRISLTPIMIHFPVANWYSNIFRYVSVKVILYQKVLLHPPIEPRILIRRDFQWNHQSRDEYCHQLIHPRHP